MSIRVDSSPLISGAVVVGTSGLGVLAENIPTTGEHGGGIAASWLGPEDVGKEARVLITTWPSVGSLFVFEDTSFEYDGPSTSFEAQLYLDGIPVGVPQLVSINIASAHFSGGSDANLIVSTIGAGSVQVSGGSSSNLSISTMGGGSDSVERAGGSNVSLSISTTGSGTTQVAGGAASYLSIAALGGGNSSPSPTSGIVLSNPEVLSVTSTSVSLRIFVTRT
jgi:hypothetical protein